MRMKKIVAGMLLLFLIALTGTGKITYAAGVNAEKENPLVLVDEEYSSVQIVAGEKVHVIQKIKVKEGHYLDPQFTINSETGSSISFKNLVIKNTDPRYSNSGWILMSTADEEAVTLEYDIYADDFATIGTYQYSISCGVKEWVYNEFGAEEVISELGTIPLEVSLISEKIPPQISIISGGEQYANAGETVQIKFTLENQGELKAMDTYVEADYAAFDRILIPKYTPLKQKIGNLALGSSAGLTLSYKVAENAETQTIKLPVNITYKMENGVECSEVVHIYLHITGREEPQATPTPTPVPEQKTALLLLNTVKQSPEEPMAGEKINVTFYLENKGNTDVKNIKVSANGLSSNGFEPVNSEPYKFISSIKAGTREKVELSFKVGKDIAEGLNTLNIQYTYDVESEYGMSTEAESVTLYILNVQNPGEEEVTVSRPKLMVSDFYTNVEEVKAGNVFDFTFEIMNTNDSIDAKNIKVTVNGASNAFSVTAGGNSFFVNEIKAQEKAPITINLKASAAATTGAYPIQIKIEYEYEGMVATSSYSGEVVEEEILLQVKENLRPSVENIMLGWGGDATVNQPVTMSFEFYNMGKSMLNNTYVTVEGDFMLSNGSNSYYIGNIAAGMPEYIEFDVIPLMEGEAVGKMIIHMEDSNGDEVTMEKEFTSYVMGEIVWNDPGMWEDPGYMDPGFSDPSIPVDGDTAKKPILSLWMFLGLQVVILIVVIPVTRAVRLAAYRRKIKREDAI